MNLIWKCEKPPAEIEVDVEELIRQNYRVIPNHIEILSVGSSLEHAHLNYACCNMPRKIKEAYDTLINERAIDMSKKRCYTEWSRNVLNKREEVRLLTDQYTSIIYKLLP